MASAKFTTQQVTKVSVNKPKLLELASNLVLDEKDYRVFLVLLTELEGWRFNQNYALTDPCNFKKIDIKSIAKITHMKKKEVKMCIQNLMRAGFLDSGSSDAIEKGYRFTF